MRVRLIASVFAFASTLATRSGNAQTPAIAAPQPIRPASASCVTSATPLLRWTGGDDTAHIRLCRDRACTTVIDEFDAQGRHATPRQPLAAGVVFWNVRSGGVESPTWSFVVQAHPTAHDLVLPRCTDVDGDGYGDAILAETTRGGRAPLFVGGPRGLSARGRPVRLAPLRDRLGDRFAAFLAGDLDGDGRADLVSSLWNASLSGDREHSPVGAGRGGVIVVTGAPRRTGLQQIEIVPPAHEWLFGATIEPVGDVNGDGRGDVAITSQPMASSPCPLRVAIVSVSPTAFAPLDVSNMGCEVVDRSIADAGDVDGDGFSDVLIATTANPGRPVRVRLFYGAVSGTRATVDLDVSVISPRANDEIRVAGIGDIDADGYADFAVSVADGGRIAIWHGTRGALAAPTLVPAPHDVDGAWMGLEITNLGDLDGDDRSEFAYSVSDTTMAFVRGGDTHAAVTFTHGDGQPTGYFGGRIEPIGDVDGDGFADVIVGTTCAQSDDVSGDRCVRSEFHLYRGGSGGMDESRRRSVVP